VNVLNKGTIDIKSIDFKYSLDNGVPISFNWGGTINPGQSASITLPPTDLTNGPHMLNIKAELVNASPDDVTFNNSISGSFRAIVPVQDTAFSQDFDTSIFPPDGWNYIAFNPNNLMKVFAKGGFGNSPNSLKMDNFSGNENISGQVDYFMSPAIDCSTSEKLVLSFSVAYAQYDATSKDKLQVLISTDCGNSWTNAYDKQGSELKTAPAATSSWSPSATQWRSESISLTPYAGESSVIVMFAATSNFGNNLYIDDINLESTLGNVDLTVQNNLFKVYPNPTTGIIELLVDDQFTKSNINGKVFSNDGKLIQTFSIPQSQTSKQLDLTEFPGGIYQIQLSNDQVQISKSVIKK
ncbi:MAG: choice-of-anchor J domain-containing protein, partial [Saprospiraceae bacterium]